MVEELDPTDSVAIADAQTLISDGSLVQELAVIRTRYSRLPDIIEQLEASNVPLSTNFQLLGKLEEVIGNSGGTSVVTEKFNAVMTRNPGLKHMAEINLLLSGESVSEGVKKQYSACELSSFVRAPLTSCDVERTFFTL